MTQPEQRSDEDLATSLSKGDASAGATLAQRYAPGVYDFAIRVTLDPAAAEQAAENTLNRFAAEIGNRPNGLSFQAWLFGIARDEALEGLRQRARGDGSREEPQPGALAPMDSRFLHANGNISRDASAWAWGSARGQRPRDYSILDLLLRRKITPEEVADIASLSRNGVYGVIGRLRGGFEESFIAAALYSSGQRNCGDLGTLVGGAPSLGPSLRREISRHAETCTTCQSTKESLPAAADVFTALENVDIPDALADKLLPIMLAAMPEAEAAAEAAEQEAEEAPKAEAEPEPETVPTDIIAQAGAIAAAAGATAAEAAEPEAETAEQTATPAEDAATRSTQAPLFDEAAANAGPESSAEAAIVEPEVDLPADVAAVEQVAEAPAELPAVEPVAEAATVDPVEAEATPPTAEAAVEVPPVKEDPPAAVEATAAVADETPIKKADAAEEPPAEVTTEQDSPPAAEAPRPRGLRGRAAPVRKQNGAAERPVQDKTPEAELPEAVTSPELEETKLAAASLAPSRAGGKLLPPSTIGARSPISDGLSSNLEGAGVVASSAGVAVGAAGIGGGTGGLQRRRESMQTPPPAAGSGGPPNSGPFARPVASDDDGNRKKYVIYAFALVATLVALYVGIAVGDSLQTGGGGGSGSNSGLPTRASGITEASCPGPINLNQGGRVNLTFSDIPGGYEIVSNPGIRPVSPTSAVTQVEATSQQGNSILFSANTVPNSNGRTDEYRITATFAKGSDRQPQECTVRVVGPAGSPVVPSATQPAVAPTNTAVPATATRPPATQPPVQPTAVPTATPDLSTPTSSVPTPVPTAGGQLISPTETFTPVPTPTVTRTPLPPP